MVESTHPRNLFENNHEQIYGPPAFNKHKNTQNLWSKTRFNALTVGCAIRKILCRLSEEISDVDMTSYLSGLIKIWNQITVPPTLVGSVEIVDIFIYPTMEMILHFLSKVMTEVEVSESGWRWMYIGWSLALTQVRGMMAAGEWWSVGRYVLPILEVKEMENKPRFKHHFDVTI